MEEKKDFDKFKELNEKFTKEYETYKKSVKKPNILVVGATGVGKSSLINCVFGENVANVDAGKPVTKGINKYEKSELDVVLFDSEGYELGNEKQSIFKEQVVNFIDENENSPEKQIHLVWYCISAANHRITDLDISTIKEIKAKGKAVGVVYTQCDSVTLDEIEELENVVKELNIKSFRITTMKNEEVGYLELEDLIFWSKDELTDDILKRAFIRTQVLDLDLKKKEAEKIVTQHTTASAFVGFTPIPFSDAPILIANQGGMVARILYVYDLEKIGQQIPALVSSLGVGTIISSLGINASGYLLGQLLKLVPGLGTIAGGIINGTVAIAITGAIGLAISEIAYRIVQLSLEGELNEISDFIQNQDSLFKEIFKEQLKNILKNKTI